MVDFKKQLGGKKSFAKLTNPVEIYETLDRASDKGPLRPAQKAILEEWHAQKRTAKDVIVKMHTGQGKTLIGLLILQSKLNEDSGPALYLCPNNHLVDQTVAQGKQFGISCLTASGELPTEFLEGRQILVTSVQKLFNGLTKFKLGAQSHSVGVIVMDDCHACADAIRKQCVIELPHTHRAYSGLLALFAEDLKEQGAGTFADIREQKFDSFLAVPYWSWMDHHEDVAAILAKDSATKEIKYAWPLLRDILRDCVCVVSGQAIEIAPQLAPLHMFGSYSGASHRVFMSATVTNDAFLVKGLGLSAQVITSPMIDKHEKWSGEKMILIPSLISSELRREEVISSFAPPNDKRKYGRVVLTPSFRVAAEWSAEGAVVADKDSIYQFVEDLKAGIVDRTVVIANRYDGIDLPDRACRILILDSKPYSETLVDRWTESSRIGSEVIAIKVARTIEQGLGRSVRGEKDYSVIILTGPDLIKTIRTKKSREYFSTQTQTQIEIGLEITELAKEEIGKDSDPSKVFTGLIQQCVGREEGWKEFYSERMSKMSHPARDSQALELFSAEHAAETQFQEGQAEKAVHTLQQLVDHHIREETEKGWYLQEMARYRHLANKTESNELQIAAHRKNRFLFKPRHGMTITKISAVGHKRIEAMIRWIQEFDNATELLLEVDDMLSRLRFGVSADSFEAALDELGRALGFETQRPDKEWKQGPDNLWALRDNQYLLLECKNQVDKTRKEINKDETGQMNNSCAWFTKHYGDSSVINLMVIWTRTVGAAGGFNEPVGIVTEPCLSKLAKKVRGFFEELRSADLASLSTSKVQANLEAYGLTIEDVVSKYSEKPKQM